MRAVLKTVAQCHVHNILHRDIKPGNFMLASKEEEARIKAIDFGLAVPYREGESADFTMQGTPWCAPPSFSSPAYSRAAIHCQLGECMDSVDSQRTYLADLLITVPII